MPWFWVLALCSDVVGYHSLGGTCCLHLQGEVSGSESVSLGFKPLVGIHGHILAFKKYFSVVCHIKESQSLCCVYIYILYIYCFSSFLFIIFNLFYFSIIYKDSMYMSDLSVGALSSRLCLLFTLTGV